MSQFLFIALFLAFGVILALGNQVLITETFDERDVFASGKWVKSKAAKYVGQPVNVMPTGEEYFPDDKGVQLTQEMKHYGFGMPFSEPVTFKGKDTFIQYEVKFVDTLNCGGAYIKLLRGGAPLEELDGSTPYSIMFGPDKCGGTNKVHFIIQYENPVSHKWEEKHFNETIPVKTDKRTHLFTLAIHADNSFAISLDNREVKKGSLLTHFEPAINPSKTIPDPSDVKPADWVDEETIVDETATKPDDWDESQPRKIEDEKAVKPADWHDDEPETIPNPDIPKPEDWDDEEDGEWESPHIPNPKCDQSGCGEWKRPMIDNPLYKGKWLPPKIPNPEYKGPWAPRQIPNANYFEHASPVDHLAPMSALAVEVWTTNSGIHFDNFIVTDSKDALTKFTTKTWKAKHEMESKAYKNEQKEERARERERIMASGTSQEKIRVMVTQLFEYFIENPMIGVATALAVIVPFFYIIFFGGKNPSVDVDGNPVDNSKPAKEEEDEDNKEKEDKNEKEDSLAATEKKTSNKEE